MEDYLISNFYASKINKWIIQLIETTIENNNEDTWNIYYRSIVNDDEVDNINGKRLIFHFWNIKIGSNNTGEVLNILIEILRY